MYNLFVAYDTEAWDGQPFVQDRQRWVREYTDNEIRKKFDQFDDDAITALKNLPCIFAYEAVHQEASKFGVIRRKGRRRDSLQIEYEIIDIQPFLTFDQFSSKAFDLDIMGWEMSRTRSVFVLALFLNFT